MRFKCKIDITDFLLLILLLSMLLAQTSYMSIKLVLIVLIAAINLLKGRYRPELYNPAILSILLVILLSGAYRLVSASCSGTMSPVELMKKVPFLVIHPFLFYLLLPNLMGYRNHRKVGNILVLGHILILLFSFYNLVAVFYGMRPIQLAAEEETFIASEEGVGISSGVVYQAMIMR